MNTVHQSKSPRSAKAKAIKELKAEGFSYVGGGVWSNGQLFNFLKVEIIIHFPVDDGVTYFHAIIVPSGRTPK